MAEENENTVTLKPHKYDKIGIIHCGVIREGRIAVAGDVSDIADGQEVKFDKVNVSVKRSGDEYVFTKH